MEPLNKTGNSARIDIIEALEKLGLSDDEIDDLIARLLEQEAQNFLDGVKEIEKLHIEEDVFRYKTDPEFSAKVDNLINDLKTKKEGNK